MPELVDRPSQPADRPVQPVNGFLQPVDCLAQFLDSLREFVFGLFAHSVFRQSRSMGEDVCIVYLVVDRQALVCLPAALCPDHPQGGVLTVKARLKLTLYAVSGTLGG